MTVTEEKFNNNTLSDEQREMFHKIVHCYKKFRVGCESALEASVILHHYDNGLFLNASSNEEAESLVLQYVKEKF